MHSGILSGLPPLLESRGALNLDGDIWGVEEPAHIVASGQKIYRPLLLFEFNGERYRLFRHPQHYINEDLKAWYKNYSVLEYVRKPDFEELPVLWLDYVTVYERYLNKFKEVQRKNGK